MGSVISRSTASGTSVLSPSALGQPTITASPTSSDSRAAGTEDGERPGTTAVQTAELREAKKRIKTREQEVEVLRRAAAYFSQAHLPGK